MNDNNWHKPPKCHSAVNKSPNYDFADRLSIKHSELRKA